MAKFPGFDHIDCRVPSLAAVEPFYDQFFPAFGLSRTRYAHVDASGQWYDVDAEHPANTKEYYEAVEPGAVPYFVGIIEDRSMRPTLTRIAFRLGARAELYAWQPRVLAWGAKNVEWCEDMDAYPALFFEDPAGTKLELCCRNPYKPDA
jgi:catechol 2,3-dioxygenase-like lactoylglutathione lyase family enzyme